MISKGKAEGKRKIDEEERVFSYVGTRIRVRRAMKTFSTHDEEYTIT